MQIVPVNLEIPPVIAFQVRKNQTGKQRLNRCQHHKSARNQRRELGNETGVDIIRQNRDKEEHRKHRQDQGKNSEKTKRLVVAVQIKNSSQNTEAVSEGIQLRGASLRPIALIHDHDLDLHVVVDRVNRHFRVNIKAP